MNVFTSRLRENDAPTGICGDGQHHARFGGGGPARLVSADPASRYTRPLAELLTLAFGPHLVIGEEFGSLEAIAVASYGSWAARYEGIPDARQPWRRHA